MARELKKISVIKTKEVLQYLHAYLDSHGFTNKKKSVVALLGCGDRTAARLMKRDGSYDSKMPYRWALRICIVTGNDVLGIVPDQARTWVYLLQGWKGGLTTHGSFRAANTMGEALVLRAHGRYMLNASFTAGIEGNSVDRLELHLSTPTKTEDVYILSFYYKTDIRTDKESFWFRCVHPNGDEVADRIVSHQAVDQHISNIHNKFKNEWKKHGAFHAQNRGR